MRRTQLVVSMAVIATALVAGAPARASTDSTYTGGCGFDATTDPSGLVANPDVFTGVMYSDTVVYSTGTPSDNPVSATVTCRLTVNGVTQVQATYAGTILVTGETPIQYAAPEGSLVGLCDVVDFTSNATPTITNCGDTTPLHVPPQEVSDLLSAVFESLDPAICGVLAAASPGVPGVVEVTSDGDVFVGGEFVYDCPPYGDPGATEVEPWGSLCALTSLGAGGGVQAGEIDAGPLVLAYGEGTRTATVRCSVHVDGAHHSDPAAANASATGTGVVTLLPTVVSFAAGQGQTVYLCTRLDFVGGEVLYLDAGTGGWSTSASAACRGVYRVGLGSSGTRLSDGPGGSAGRDVKPPGGKKRDPYYPSGTISIAQDALGNVTYSATAFTPAYYLWACTFGTLTVTCTPPAPPTGKANVCGKVGVDAQATTSGATNGASACNTGPFASTTSTGPSADKSSASASPSTAFPWTCDATPATSVWSVTCRVAAP